MLEKQKVHHSNKYDDAPMPYMERLSWSGLALHGGHPHGRPASHGCIRMPMGFAAALFKEQTRGMQVVIKGHAPEKPQTVLAASEHRNSQSDSEAAQTPSGQGDGNASAGESEDQVNIPANYGNGDFDQLRNDERNDYQGQNERDPSQNVPPPDLPPPPGE